MDLAGCLSAASVALTHFGGLTARQGTDIMIHLCEVLLGCEINKAETRRRQNTRGKKAKQSSQMTGQQTNKVGRCW